MESIYLIVSIFLVFDNTPNIAAGLFDPIRNIFEPSHNTPAKVIDSFLSPFRDDLNGPGPQFHHNKGKSHRSPRAWWAVDPSPGAPIIHNIFNDPPVTPDYDKIVAQQFPEATNILEKLKELNKLKEEQKKQHDGGGGNAGGSDFGGPGTSGSIIGINETPKPSDFGDHTKPVMPVTHGDNSEEQPTEKTTTDGPNIMKSITKRHFYFQVQPVRPEEENNRTSETIYYV